MQATEPSLVETSTLSEHIGERVRVRGWLHAVRDLGTISFLILRDGRGGTAQLVCSREIRAQLGEAGPESVLEATGVVHANPRAPGGLEIEATKLTVVSEVTETLPVTLGKKKLSASLPVLLDHAPLTLRHPERRAVFRLSALAMQGFRQTLTELGFTEIQTPKLVESATEGGANVFEVEYFGRKAYLAQSPQFYKQIMVGVFERVFEVGPVFRAEPHATSRHINEYVSLDVEMGFIESHEDVMRVLREVLAGMLTTLERHGAGELELLETELPEVPAKIPAVPFEEAQRIAAAELLTAVSEEPDLSPAEERALGTWALREHQSAFLFVTAYPLHKRPFYTHPNPERPEASNSFDLLFRGTELVTGGQRLHRYEDYVSALSRRGLPTEPFESYLQTFRYGMPPHGGFAIGLERFLTQLLGAENLREVTLFPRDLTRLSP